MLKCKLCSYETQKVLSHHLKSAHKITAKEYKNLFPDAEVTSDEFKLMMAERNKSDKMRNITITRNKSDKMREIIRNRNYDKEFQRKCKEGLNREDVKAKQRERMSKVNKENWQKQEYRDYMHNLISKKQKEYMNTQESIERQRAIMHRNWLDPEIAKAMLDAPKKSWRCQNRGTFVSNKFGKEFHYKSQGELDFITICEENDSVTDLEYETIHIEMNSGHVYTPDFLVTQNNKRYLIEIKFDETQYNFKEKFNSVVKYCLANDIELCWMRRFNEVSELKKDCNFSKYALCRTKIE